MKPKNINIQGFSLIEVLVSLIILSIGLLGLMSVLLLSIQGNNNSNLRTQATIAAYDMSERIRANIPGFKAGKYNAITTTTAGADCTTCSTSDLAKKDIFEWHKYLADNLPEGKGSVLPATNADDGLDITVFWKESDKSGSSKEKQFILRVRNI